MNSSNYDKMHGKYNIKICNCKLPSAPRDGEQIQ
jgi:hypothetical protein